MKGISCTLSTNIFFIDVSSAWFLSLDKHRGNLHLTNWTSNKNANTTKILNSLFELNLFSWQKLKAYCLYLNLKLLTKNPATFLTKIWITKLATKI